MNTIDVAVIDRVLSAIQQNCPLIHNITNLVAMNASANVLLAMGASPLMAHAPEELEDIVRLSHALVLNIGTLDQAWLQSMQQAQKIALEAGKPIVLDPVGAGASPYRTQASKTLLQTGVSVVRGNAAEIMALCDQAVASKGVDSSYASDAAIIAAQHLSLQYNCCVVVSGVSDYVISVNGHYQVTGGDALLTQVTGMGCSTTAMIAACCAVEADTAIAAVTAMTCMASAAEQARLIATGPGSFYPALLDAIATRVMTPTHV